MLIVIILLALILVLVTVFNKNDDKFVSVENKEFTISRPNCAQLNNPDVCINTPGCFSMANGCINNYKELQEPQKEWEKGDFMIVY